MSGRASPTADGGRVTRFLIAGLVGVYLLFAYSLAINTHHGVGPGGAPPFYDFGAFYQAGALADSGNATGAYNDAAMVAAERSAFPGTTTRLPWNYPPTFLLPFMPLAALPYVVAWAAWSGLTYGLYVLAVRRLVAPYQLWLMLLAPAAAVNLFVGQNGTLSVALIAGGVLLLRNRPIVAGMVLGLLAYKPQFAVLAPLVLLCGREWRALISAAVSWTALSLLSVVILGVDPWIAFLHKAAAPANIFTSSSSSWLAIPSTMILARSLGLGPTVSSVL
ncbi:MAG TPA: glycosyltransferase family 87 protein, partial [Caulobacteraceae bacterium]|nr:glycosyltransferase family 87 protein [Caulobacteraceae bacterium]